jgi:hypothetical protein
MVMVNRSPHQTNQTIARNGMRPFGARLAVPRLAAIVTSLILSMSVGADVALGVVGGKTISITAAPWTVAVWEPTYPGHPRYVACTGVIIDPLHILTAGHCVMVGNSAKPLSVSGFRIEAGVSDFRHPNVSDHPQIRTVSAVQAMPGYIAASKLTVSDYLDVVGHDLAVLTLSRPLSLRGEDARAAYLPGANTLLPASTVRLVMAGFGNETPKTQNGTLNQVTKATVRENCSSNQVLCLFSTTDTCWGDSGSGAVESAPRPIVVGIMSEDLDICRPGVDYYVSLIAPAALRFIRASRQGIEGPRTASTPRFGDHLEDHVGGTERFITAGA